MLCRFLQRGGLGESESVATVNTFLGLSEKDRLPSEIEKGVTLESINIELQRASDLLAGGPKLVPILYLADEEVLNSIQTADTIGIDGVNFFGYKNKRGGLVERVAQFINRERASGVKF